ncbi:MAG TPA: CBS domain-containing protein [Chitinophagaceae bacterium]|nr:CBS domain-containing protein [Chitinophagaceae bacterium]
MHTVSDILVRKGASAVAVKPDTKVIDALLLMTDKNIGSILVMDGGEYSGIVTERDCVRKIILKSKPPAEISVSEIMCTNLPSVLPSDTVELCMKLMIEKNIRYLPVFENELISGIISMSDVVMETILEKKESKDHLEKYIHSDS